MKNQLKVAEWKFDSVREAEAIACLYYEYGREATPGHRIEINVSGGRDRHPIIRRAIVVLPVNLNPRDGVV